MGRPAPSPGLRAARVCATSPVGSGRLRCNAVAQWKRGAKRPPGPAARPLEVLDPEKEESPVVQVRRGRSRAG